MITLTKRGLASQLSHEGRFHKISQDTFVDIIETLFDLIVLHLQNGGYPVTIRGFGSFRLSKRKEFLGFDVNSGRMKRIGSKNTIAYKPSSEIGRRLNPK